MLGKSFVRGWLCVVRCLYVGEHAVKGMTSVIDSY